MILLVIRYGFPYTDMRSGCNRLTSYCYYTSFQIVNPLPKLSSSMARATTFRLSALNGPAYCLALICSVAASIPPLLLSFNSNTYI